MIISTGSVAAILLALALGGTCILALMLYYHWVRYGVGVLSTFSIMVAYALGVAVLVVSALGVFAQL